MRKLSAEDEERKKFIFDSMSPRRQKHILKKEGYDAWDPFIEPKEPIDMREDKSKPGISFHLECGRVQQRLWRRGLGNLSWNH